MNIEVRSSVEEAARAAADCLNGALAHGAEKPTLLLVAGGSALGILEHINPTLLDARLTLGVSDERFSTDQGVSNFAQVLDTRFGENAVDRGVSLIDTRPMPEETLVALGERFAATLKAWRTANPNGHIVVTLGVGSDGHTAGIMPFPEDSAKFAELFEKKDAWVAAYDAAEKNEYPLRATVTMSFLRNEVDEAIVYVVGENKRGCLTRTLAKEGSLAETPARIVREMKSVKLFTDQQL